MGDHATAKWAEKWRAAVPLSVGEELGPHLTKGTKWFPDPSSCLTTTDMG